MKGRPASARVYLDANFLIRLVEAEDRARTLHLDLWDAIDAERVVAVTSAITWSEVLVQPLRLQDEALVQVYGDILTGQEVPLTLIDITPAILREAAALRAANGALKLIDAIHIASAVDAGCGHLVSSDRRLGVLRHLPLLDPDSNADVPRYLSALP